MKLLIPLAEQAFQVLKLRGETLGFAESCTGGLLSATFAAIPGVSEVFLGSVVSYSNVVKKDLLAVSTLSLSEHGAVSEQVAQEMVRGAANTLKCDWAISVTGVAGPTGGSAEKPVGTIWIALKGPNVERAERFQFAGVRGDIQRSAVEYAIKILLKELNH